jgi:hypothetical protein
MASARALELFLATKQRVDEIGGQGYGIVKDLLRIWETTRPTLVSPSKACMSLGA